MRKCPNCNKKSFNITALWNLRPWNSVKCNLCNSEVTFPLSKFSLIFLILGITAVCITMIKPWITGNVEFVDWLIGFSVVMIFSIVITILTPLVKK